jgi:hypothetical protein
LAEAFAILFAEGYVRELVACQSLSRSNDSQGEEEESAGELHGFRLFLDDDGLQRKLGDCGKTEIEVSKLFCKRF